MTPTLGAFGTDLYAELTPLAYADEQNGWALAHYLDSIGSMFDEVESYARDGENGEPGWSILVDLNRAPYKALPWLGQLVGVQVPSTLSDADARARIFNHPGFQRGTPMAIISAAQTHLTGSKDVLMIERFTGSAYKLYIATRAAQTPSSSQTLADILEQKPAGIQLTYETIAGQSFNELLATGTFQDVYTTYATMQGVLTGTPGT